VYSALVLTDPNSEKPSDFVYLPRDEAFGHTKSSDFLAYALKSVSQDVLPVLTDAFDGNILSLEFDNFQEVHKLYEGGVTLPTNFLSKYAPIPVLKEILRTDGEQFLKYPLPHVMKGVLHTLNKKKSYIFIYISNALLFFIQHSITWMDL